MTLYLAIKFVHVFVAITLIGGGTGIGFVQRLAAKSPVQLSFAHRSAKRFYEALFGPGLAVLLATGLWMATTNWSLALLWIRGALVITTIVLIAMYLLVAPAYGWLAEVVATDDPESSSRRRPERITQLVGGGSSLLIIVVIWLMVTKPA